MHLAPNSTIPRPAIFRTKSTPPRCARVLNADGGVQRAHCMGATRVTLLTTIRLNEFRNVQIFCHTVVYFIV